MHSDTFLYINALVRFFFVFNIHTSTRLHFNALLRVTLIQHNIASEEIAKGDHTFRTVSKVQLHSAYIYSHTNRNIVIQQNTRTETL